MRFLAILLLIPMLTGAQFKNGSVWKAESDHQGTLVLVFAPRFDQEFNWCKVPYKPKIAAQQGRTYEKLRFSGWANPINGKDRMHYRGNFHGRRYKNNAIVRCKLPHRVVKFRLHGRASQYHA
jgi:hypothetical protein